MSEISWRAALADAERALASAGVPSPRVDAELLAAHVTGVPRSRLLGLAGAGAAVLASFRELVERRTTRIPLQYLLGTAPMGPVDVAVGPGVFVPRLETELLLEWGLGAIAGAGAPVVVDLCTGSGALAAAVAVSRPDAEVYAVELDPAALSWARKNLPDRVHLVQGDVTDSELLPELRGRVALVLANPPYVPEGTPVPPEVAEHDPHRAVFAGPDGLEVIRPLVVLAIRLLRPGGALGIEHDDSHATAAPAVLAAHPELTAVVEHPDLAGRPRFVTAARRG
ncbi:MAG: release factor glutamine methyltransferase [Pseudonocardiales bacterium]|nr:release factor glutamine methyltransferase [Pseudonocardiales bacterium]MDT7637079.1 release factor glutamine methyltransferase [Pseudonocardiales bacterium]MDT7663071.1 release factor glutamine methyltransferase [Pseudonocardiales bacterium]